METHEIHNEAAESIDVTSRFMPDPTSATPYFALSAKGTNTPGTFFEGAWRTGSTWSSTTGQIIATTPTIGADGSLVIAAGTDYWLWQRVTVGFETFVDKVAIISCPG